MSTNYSVADVVVGADHLLTYMSGNGDWREVPVSVLLTYMNANISTTNALTKQASAPSATGFSVPVTSGNTWLLITPTAGFAAGTIVLPAGVDGELVNVSCTQYVTTLTVIAASAVTGAPASLDANDAFTMRYDSTTDAWYRVS